MKNKRLTIFAALTLVGCAALQTGQDPLVVRTEQVEVLAYSTFDEFLKIDDIAMSNATVAPTWQGAHVFAQYLRKPTLNGTNTVPFAIATILSLDAIKVAYQNKTASSNTLSIAITTLTATLNQASQYTGLIGLQTTTNLVTH